MKKLIICIVLLSSLSTFSFSQNSILDNVFKKYAMKDGFTTVTISSDLFNMFIPEEDKIADGKIGNIKILAVDEDDLNENLNFYKDIVPNLKRNQYKELMHVKSSDGDVIVLQSKKGNGHNEFLLVSGGESNALIYIEGTLDFSEGVRVSNILKEKRAE